MKDMKNLTKYCIIIPAYNAENTLTQLINKIIEVIPSIPIFIINDGSSDSTKNINNVNIVDHEKNLGKGAAIQSGIKIAKSRNFEYAVFLDADLQHDPDRIMSFIEKQQQTKADLVIGKRDFNLKSMPFFRFLSNTITSKLISLRTGIEINDSQCGFRLIRLNSIDIEDYFYSGFQFESEFLIKYLLRNKNVVEVEIPTIYATEKSSINHIPDTLKFIKLYFHSFLWKKERKH